MKTKLILMACILTLAGRAGADPLIEVRPDVTVSGQDVLLKDIAGAPAALPSGWGERVLLPAPKPGESSEYSLMSIALVLQKHQDMREALLRGQKTIRIQRASIDLASEKITRLLERFVAEDEKWENIETRIQCEPLKTKLNLPKGDLKLEVKDYTPQNEANRYLFNVVATVNASITETVPVYAKIIPQQAVWVSKGVLRQGECLNAEDLQTRMVDADSAGIYMPADEAIDGLELSQTVRENEPLKRHSLVQPLCVRSGETLHVTETVGAMAVTLKAKALGSGRTGDHIFCLNEQSKQRLRVKLVGEKQAVMD